MKAPPDLTCVHAAARGREGLCPECVADWHDDPTGYLQYGDHPAGLARLAELKAEMEAEALALAPYHYDPEMPL